MEIWHKKYTLDELKQYETNMQEHLGIKITELGDDFLKGTMPVDEKTKQPFGLLHGGASCVLAETLGSIASALCVDLSQNVAVGMSINANHIRSKKSGLVIGTAKAIHLGAKSHVWEIKITDEKDSLICISRLTTAIIKRKSS